MTIIGVYHPGRSIVHRCPPGPKLLGLVIGLALTLRYPFPALVVTIALFAAARVPARLALGQIRPLWPILLLTGAFRLMDGDVERAAEIVVGLGASVALAGLVTLTTRVTVMLDALAAGLRPLRRLGVDPERVALLLALTIRCVPLLVEIMRSVREAQLARGAGRNPIALAVPVVVRALRASDALGEALAARGFDD